MRFSLISSILILAFAHYSSTDAYLFDPKAVDALLREIRARLQATGEDRHEELPEAEDIKKEELLKARADEDLEEHGSGEEIEGSGETVSTVTGVPILEEKKEEVKKPEIEIFPRPEPIFDRYGNLKSKDQIEALTFANFKKQAPATLQDHYNLNPTGTLQMLQGLDIHGPSGGYHRALSGGYLPPPTYDPYNVNWHSYGEEGVKMKDKAIAVFRRVLAQGA
uniref:Uncharacterized protein n=1 Tax=Caenorhabditis japonica TaxID=281687 RepID=A0A8R1IDX5_CAEJA